jgi:hypothetical protein
LFVIHMKKILFFFALACFISLNGFSQNCSAPFAAGTTNYVEVCNPSGPDTYALSVLATSDSALTFEGLWTVPSTLIAADVDCNTQSFTIPRQTIQGNFQIRGRGELNFPAIDVHYAIFLDSVSTTPLDSCNGNYGAVSLGLSPAFQAQCKLYPNPATSLTHLEISGANLTGSWTYLVLDMQGRTVSEGNLDAQMAAVIDTRAFAKGMYQVIAQGAEGQFVSKALVVE